MTNSFFKDSFSVQKNDKLSYQEHDSQYAHLDLEKERERQQKNYEQRTEYTENAPLGLAIDMSSHIKIAIDIGCGTGMAANLLSKTMDIVYAIEPSKFALNIAKNLYPDNKKITWIKGFANEEIEKISVDKPILFNSLCVLSHLQDDNVKSIARAINKIALPKSILSFSECYGCEYSDNNLWHIRTESWWQEQFKDWNLNFCGHSINHPPGAKKIFTGVRKS